MNTSISADILELQ